MEVIPRFNLIHLHIAFNKMIVWKIRFISLNSIALLNEDALQKFCLCFDCGNKLTHRTNRIELKCNDAFVPIERAHWIWIETTSTVARTNFDHFPFTSFLNSFRILFLTNSHCIFIPFIILIFLYSLGNGFSNSNILDAAVFSHPSLKANPRAECIGIIPKWMIITCMRFCEFFLKHNWCLQISKIIFKIDYNECQAKRSTFGN